MKRFLIVIGFMLSGLFVNAQLAQEWVQRYNYWTQNGNDSAIAMVIDDSANVYVTGVSAGVNGYMDYLTIKYTTTGTFVWEQRFNGAGNWHDYANAIAIDDSGNVYVTGTSFGGGFTPTNNYVTIKYSRGGTQQWLKEYDYAVNYDEARAIGIDDSGFIYVTGSGVASNGEDFLTIKYDGNGNLIWTAAYDGAGNNIDVATELGMDASGNIYIAGHSRGTNGYTDYAAVKYNSSGIQQWVVRYNLSTINAMSFSSMDVNEQGVLAMTGQGYSPSTSFCMSSVAYDSTGILLWTNVYSNSQSTGDVGMDVFVDSYGNVYVTGGNDWPSYDFVTIKYNLAGAQQWINYYNYLYLDVAYIIEMNPLGQIVVAGGSVFSAFNYDYATVTYDANTGSQIWAARYNGLGNGQDRPTAMAFDSTGNVYVTGHSYGGGTGDDFATVKYGYATGVNVGHDKAETFVSPNPSSGLLTIMTDLSEFHLMVYSTEGRLIKSQTNDRNLDITNESDGIYFVHLYDADGKVQVQKLVKTSAE